jgi:hypothetical protein
MRNWAILVTEYMERKIMMSAEDRNYIAKIGDFGQASFEFAQFSMYQATSFPCANTKKK